MYEFEIKQYNDYILLWRTFRMRDSKDDLLVEYYASHNNTQ